MCPCVLLSVCAHSCVSVRLYIPSLDFCHFMTWHFPKTPPTLPSKLGHGILCADDAETQRAAITTPSQSSLRWATADFARCCFATKASLLRGISLLHPSVSLGRHLVCKQVHWDKASKGCKAHNTPRRSCSSLTTFYARLFPATCLSMLTAASVHMLRQGWPQRQCGRKPHKQLSDSSC